METVRFSISIENDLLKRFDNFIKAKGYQKRSKAIRDLIRDSLTAEEWEKDEEVTGSLTLLYNHHIHGLTEEIIETEHMHGDIIIVTTHVHLDEENCLEVLLLKGNAKRLRNLANTLISKKGVKLGKLTLCSTGKKLGSQ